ncbi:hypothetical protein KC19_1G132800 [Ceratodon purpureus]|uniref:Uncharacterized protein n=1 Tax=Ceratodon purpureus TaxID=3225 RepID=A0A8T0J4P9_CERPU|nr:hypothetical protein KC19_1G132800 [Ceratodon purpureus]
MGSVVRVVVVMLCVVLVMVAMVVEARPSPLFDITGGGEEGVEGVKTGRKLFKLVSNTLVLPYHNGPLLAGAGALNVYVVWYGTFSPAQKAIVTDFFASFQQPGAEAVHPSVASWWKLTSGYKDNKNNVPDGSVKLAGQADDNYSMGKTLKQVDVEALVVSSLASLPADPASIYFLLTAADVEVEGFCMNTCASHSFTSASPASKNFMLPYSWVGNSGTQCPGQCAWPYALPQYGPQGAKALVAPNADAGMDGMVINLASMLAGTATNPFNNGYYQGDASAPLEAATACTGIYGAGAYPGYPGQLIVDPITSASYNAQGVGSRKYLLPALWDPATLTCMPVS